MGIDEQYQEWQEKQMLEDLLNWADIIIQQLEDVGSVALGDLTAFKKSVERFGDKPNKGEMKL